MTNEPAAIPAVSGTELEQSAAAFANFLNADSEEAEPEAVAAEDVTEEGEVEEEEELEASEPEEGEEDEYEYETVEAEVPEEPKVSTVRVDGQDVQVTQAELEAGYSRHSDYTRKTQQIAEERRHMDSERQQIAAERQQYMQVVAAQQQQLEQETKSQEYTPEYWEQLSQTDPIEWMRQREELRDKKEKSAELQQEMTRQQEIQVREQEERMKQVLAHENMELERAIPEWKSNPNRAQEEKIKLRNYGLETGFSSDEMAQVYDHRVVATLRKAMLYEELMKNGKVVKKRMKEAPAIAPGSTPQQSPRRRHTAISKTKMRLAKTGRADDASDLFRQMLDDNRI